MISSRLNRSHGHPARLAGSTLAAVCCIAALMFPCFNFVAGRHSPAAASGGSVALRAFGQGKKAALEAPVRRQDMQRQMPEGMKRQMMKRMPRTTYDTEEMMRRITTVLIKNIDEKWRDAPMKTLDIMKEIGLQGYQIKTKKYINKALMMLQGQKVIHKVKQNPVRWEIHESYREKGVPPISQERRDPFALKHLIKFESTKVPKYGPIHGKPVSPNIRDGDMVNAGPWINWPGVHSAQ
mmetsp:Transcript_61728/g.118940  ORF Transcript_61728/g.118940 Transcript_61728/m.118940 type:complete len:238 (-) Transcript_61728:147-860(-)